MPTKRARRQTRSSLLNDENIDPADVATNEEVDCDDDVAEIAKTPSRRARGVESSKKGKNTCIALH